MLLDVSGVAEDPWTLVDGGAIPPDGPVIVPFERLDEALGLRPGGRCVGSKRRRA